MNKKRGRPSNPTSKRQIRLKARQVKIDSGIPIKVGRPNKVTVIPEVLEVTV